MEVVWTDYMEYRAALRGFDLDKLEGILRLSPERYWDEATHRPVVVGRHEDTLVLIPHEAAVGVITPVTVHATTRQQINFRIRNGRFRHE